MTRRTWKNIAVPIAVPIAVSVVAGLVLAGILRLGGLLGKVVLWVWSVLSWIWELLYSSHPVPGWVILVLGLLALFGLIIIVLMLKEFLHGKSESPEPTFLTYTEDMVDGVRWSWRWRGNQIDGLWCFCPVVMHNWYIPKSSQE